MVTAIIELLISLETVKIKKTVITLPSHIKIRLKLFIILLIRNIALFSKEMFFIY